MLATKRQYLTVWDLVILTLIFFGYMIYISMSQYLLLLEQTVTVAQNLDFSDAQNYQALFTQLVLLALAIAYLQWRQFDFRRWLIQPSLKACSTGVVFFLLWSLVMDLYYIIMYQFTNSVYPSSLLAVLGEIRLSTVIYAILNGFYEELFFLGICLAVKPTYLKWAVLYSLLVRVSFHTYQGLETALGLGIVLGVVIYLLYRYSASRNLFSFGVAHSIADIFGLSVLSYFS